MLEAILHIVIDGPSPDSAEGQSIVRKAVQTWVTAKNRRRLPNPPKAVNPRMPL